MYVVTHIRDDEHREGIFWRRILRANRSVRGHLHRDFMVSIPTRTPRVPFLFEVDVLGHDCLFEC